MIKSLNLKQKISDTYDFFFRFFRPIWYIKLCGILQISGKLKSDKVSFTTVYSWHIESLGPIRFDDEHV